jgi:glycosyltransferase involved in cell wall biosynthesis
MRIGIVTGEFPPLHGGVGDYTHALALALAAHGVEVHVITDARCAGLHPSSFILHPFVRRWSFSALFQIRSLARQLKLDWLNVQYQAAAFGLGAPIHFLPNVAGVRTAVTFHDLRVPYLFPKAGRWRDWAVTHLARSAAGAIVTDAADEAELLRRGVGEANDWRSAARFSHAPVGRGVQRVARIPIGSNIPVQPPAGYDRAQFRSALGVGADDFLLGYFGFLNHSKGGDTLIRALSVLAERKARVKLALIGGQAGGSDPTDIAFGAEIEKLIARHGLENRIIRSGFISAMEVSAHLLACDAMALPYRDGASLRRGSLMAALAHGCAVISTVPPAPLPELRDGQNIRLVPPDSPAALVLAISELLGAPDLRTRLGAAARETARQFEWPRIAARQLEFLRAL